MTEEQFTREINAFADLIIEGCKITTADKYIYWEVDDSGPVSACAIGAAGIMHYKQKQLPLPLNEDMRIDICVQLWPVLGEVIINPEEVRQIYFKQYGEDFVYNQVIGLITCLNDWAMGDGDTLLYTREQIAALIRTLKQAPAETSA